MTPDDLTTHFTDASGAYRFARWGRPIAPVIFGLDQATLGVMKVGIESVALMAGHQMAELDPELGTNLMWFFCSDWNELATLPDLDRLIPDPAGLAARLDAAQAATYRTFRTDDAGAIRAAFAFTRVDAQTPPAHDLALSQAAQLMLTWGPQAFANRAPLAQTPEGTGVLHPEVAAIIRAAYDPVMPAAATDPAHALRLFARLPRDDA